MMFQLIATPTLLAAMGCAGEPTASPLRVDLPVTHQELRRNRPELQSYRHSILLDFEDPTDSLFVSTGPEDGVGTSMDVDPTAAHTGGASLRVAQASRIDIRLSSLMSGRELPGGWTLLGGFLLAERDTPVQLQYIVDDRVILRKTQSLPAGRWTPAMLDIRSLPRQSLSLGQTVLLRIETASVAPVRLDDLMLIDNTERIVDAPPWRIHQAGHDLSIEFEGEFRVALNHDHTQRDAWALVEAGALRAIVEQDHPEAQRWVIYRDGRRYVDGRLDPLIQTSPAGTEQHRTPAEISIPAEQGRLDRSSPGDLNNDGYNEQRAAYMVIAAKPRLAIQLVPRTRQIVHPAIEIRDLPDGKVVVTLEGELIDQVDRLDDGRVLMILPHRIQRPATVQVRVQ